MNKITDRINNKVSSLTKNQFPIITQLLVVGILLVVILGTIPLHKKNQIEAEAVQNDDIAIAEVKSEKYEHSIASLSEIARIDITARSAYVYDVRAGQVLYSKNADDILPLASITKLMTALLTYELMEEDIELRVPSSVAHKEQYNDLVSGEKLEADDLLQLALISSSNAAAHTLAENVGALLGDSDPIEQFVSGMNIRADELELNSMQFYNATGLDLSSTEPGAVGTARDVTYLVAYILEKYPDILSPTTEDTARIYNTEGAYHEVRNTNSKISAIPNLIGSKTGYTDLAGGNLTVAFDIGFDRPIIITVLGSTRTDRFNDVATLLNAVMKLVQETDNH